MCHARQGGGTHWELYTLGEQRGHYTATYVTGKCITGDRVESYEAERWPTEGEHVRLFWPVHWASKEAMAAAAYTAWQQGKLPTLAEQAAAEAQAKLDREAEAEARAVARKEAEARQVERYRVHSERLEAWSLAYVELAARVDLTNLERAGIEAAQMLIGKPAL